MTGRPTYVTVLPDITPVNINTAAEPTLVAAVPGLSAEQAHTLVERRHTAYFVDTSEIASVLPAAQSEAVQQILQAAQIDVNSGYFIVHCRIHSPRINTRIDTLIARYGIGDFSWTTVIWVHRLTS